jgi:Zn-dependent peptidase ImmA (M78 family)/transcriptional regulator with XRE-family HTH domain
VDRLPAPEIGERIARKRAEAGIAADALAAEIGISPADLERIERGEYDDLPGDFILIAAKVLRTDFRFFVTRVLDDEDAQTHRVYRALSNPTAEDEFRLRLFFHFVAGEAELRGMLGAPFVQRWPDYNQPARGVLHVDHGRDVARRERERLGLGLGPIENVFALIRDQGVLLLRQHFRDSSLSGLTARHPRAGTCVLVNYTDDLFRQVFSAAHEYAHVLLDRPVLDSEGCVVSYEGRKGELVEFRANAFAAEFLLPRAAFSRWKKPEDDAALAGKLVAIARTYFVNTETVLIAMQGAGWLSEEDTRSWFGRRPRIGRREKMDPDLPATLTDRQRERARAAIERGLDRRFVELAARAVRDGEITFGRAAELLDVNREDLANFFAEVGVG